MAIYSISNRTTNVTSGVATLEFRSPSAKRTKILEITITMAAATASLFGIGEAQAQGVTPTTPVTVIPEDTAEGVGQSQTALAWSTPPTIPLFFHRRVNLPATIGAGRVITFPRGRVLAANKSLLIWNLGTNGVTDIDIVTEE
jgi:hypothetical protein